MQMKINKHAVSKEAELETAIRDAYPKVYSYLYHRTLDAALSKDLTQETFYRFYRHLDQYEEQGKLLPFLLIKLIDGNMFYTLFGEKENYQNHIKWLLY